MSFTCATYGRSGTYRIIAITHKEIMLMLRKLESRVINGCRIQIYSHISHTSNIFVDNRFPLLN